MADNQGNQPEKQGIEEARIGENIWAVRWPHGAISISNFPAYAQPEHTAAGTVTYGDIMTFEIWLSTEAAKRALIDLLQKSMGGA